MDDPTYKKPLARSKIKEVLPTLEEIQAKQCSELVELAKLRYGIKGGQVEIKLTPVLIHDRMTENQIFTELNTIPSDERADCVLYALAKGDISAPLANRLLSCLRLIHETKDKLLLG
jgi:hypothetical protein